MPDYEEEYDTASPLIVSVLWGGRETRESSVAKINSLNNDIQAKNQKHGLDIDTGCIDVTLFEISALQLERASFEFESSGKSSIFFKVKRNLDIMIRDNKWPQIWGIEWDQFIDYHKSRVPTTRSPKKVRFQSETDARLTNGSEDKTLGETDLSASKIDREPESDSQPEIENTSESETSDDSETDDHPESDGDSESESESNSESENSDNLEIYGDSDAETGNDSETDDFSESEDDNDSDSDSGSNSDSGSESDGQSEDDANLESQNSDSPGSDSDSDSESGINSDSGQSTSHHSTIDGSEMKLTPLPLDSIRKKAQKLSGVTLTHGSTLACQVIEGTLISIVGYSENGKMTARVKKDRSQGTENLRLGTILAQDSKERSCSRVKGIGLVAWGLDEYRASNSVASLYPKESSKYPDTFISVYWDDNTWSWESRSTLGLIIDDLNAYETDLLIYCLAVMQEADYQESISGKRPVFPMPS